MHLCVQFLVLIRRRTERSADPVCAATDAPLEIEIMRVKRIGVSKPSAPLTCYAARRRV